jgi:cell division protein FtsQ
MSISSNIRKILFISFWCIIGAGILVLLIAAIRVKKEKVCAGYSIDIKSASSEYFLDKKDIENILTSNGSIQLKGRTLKNFDLRKMEELLEKNLWVSDAELFFDNGEALRVKISEREPIARIFTSLGDSYYIDSATVRLPLSDKFSAKLPVFTNFPSNAVKPSKQDKALLRDIKLLATHIRKDSFWMAQVAQVDITPSREFEIIPAVGNQVIEFGNAEDIEKKFRRLLIFYKQVISKTGFTKYERIRAQYAGQIVGVMKETPMSKADSLQAIKNIQKLIEMVQTEQERMMRMDSLSVIEHRTDRDGMQAKLSDTLSMIPGNKPIVPDSTKKNTP